MLYVLYFAILRFPYCALPTAICHTALYLLCFAILRFAILRFVILRFPYCALRTVLYVLCFTYCALRTVLCYTALSILRFPYCALPTVLCYTALCYFAFTYCALHTALRILRFPYCAFHTVLYRTAPYLSLLLIFFPFFLRINRPEVHDVVGIKGLLQFFQHIVGGSVLLLGPFISKLSDSVVMAHGSPKL